MADGAWDATLAAVEEQSPPPAAIFGPAGAAAAAGEEVAAAPWRGVDDLPISRGQGSAVGSIAALSQRCVVWCACACACLRRCVGVCGCSLCLCRAICLRLWLRVADWPQ